MSDTTYVLDLQVTGAELVTVNDDGAGVDAIAVQGIYSKPVEISLCWTESNGQTITAGATYFGDDGLNHRLVVNGLVENAVGSNGVDLVRGNELANILYGDTTASSPGGDDTLMGGAGNDVLYGGSGADEIAGESDNDNLFGDSGRDTISGGFGDDTIEGGRGADVLIGGGSAGDTVGFTTSDAGIRVNLTSGAASIGHGGDADSDVIDGFRNVLGSGFSDRITDIMKDAADDNSFYGFDGRDRLSLGAGNDQGYGGNGVDKIGGGEGDDALFGGAGGDKLTGGAGQDLISGGTGADRFIFKYVDDSGPTPDLMDSLTDFLAAEGDRIDLRSLDANTAIRGNQDFHLTPDDFTGVAGELRLTAQGSDLVVSGDTNGDGTADFAILVLNTATLTTADFML